MNTERELTEAELDAVSGGGTIAVMWSLVGTRREGLVLVVATQPL